ncbi:MAG: hypothetical protein Q8P20_07690 [bacterium]|nr:hypothetical protein [bacterium]
MAEIQVNRPEGEVRVRPESIAVVELTLYPSWYPDSTQSIGDTDKIRGDLALQSIAAGQANGYRIVVADGDSSTAFKEELAKYTAITYVGRQEETRGAGRRQGFLVASAIDGVEVIIRTEPEKVSIVSEYAPQITLPILEGKADIVVPKRNPNLHQSTYPLYQWESEVSANKKYNDLLHKTGLLPEDQSLDMFFGPIAFRNVPEILELFLEKYEFTLPSSIGIRKFVEPENWSDGYFFSVVKALHQGLKVVSVEVDFKYPEKQRQNEETTAQGAIDEFVAKRAQQKWGLLDELIHFIRYLRQDPKSGLKKIE